MPLRHHINVSNTLYKSNMDIRSNLSWISALNMTLVSIISTSQVNLNPQNLGTTWLVYWYKGATICPWERIPIAQTFFVCLIWMYEVVWGGYQPQPWKCAIISTPQVDLNPQNRGQLGQCNYKGATIRPWDSIPMSQTLCIRLKWMYEVVWSGFQPWPWHYGIIFTQQVSLTS